MNRVNKVITSIFILGLFLVFAGSSYSLIDEVNNGAIDNIDIKAKLSITGTSNITIDSTNTKEDESIKFTLENHDSKKVSYTIYIKENENANNNCISPCELISKDTINYELTKESTIFNTSKLDENIIDYGVIEGNSTIDYSLKIWPNNSDGTMYNGIIEVEGIIVK